MDIRICSSEFNEMTFFPTQSPHGIFKNFEIINHYGCQFSLLIQTYYFKLLFQLFFFISDRLNLIGRSELLTLIRKCQYIYFYKLRLKCRDVAHGPLVPDYSLSLLIHKGEICIYSLFLYFGMYKYLNGKISSPVLGQLAY